MNRNSNSVSGLYIPVLLCVAAPFLLYLSGAVHSESSAKKDPVKSEMLLTSYTLGPYTVARTVINRDLVFNRNIPKHDAALGALTSMTVDVEMTIDQVLWCENLDTAAGCTNWFNTENQNLTTGDPGQTYWSVQSIIKQTNNQVGNTTAINTTVYRTDLTAFDGTNDNGGTSGWSLNTAYPTVYGTDSTSNSTDLSAVSSYVGGQWTLVLDYGYDPPETETCGFLAKSQGTFGTLDIYITYTY